MRGKKRKTVCKAKGKLTSKSCMCTKANARYTCNCFSKTLPFNEKAIKCTIPEKINSEINISKSEMLLKADKYTNAIYKHSKLRKIFKAVKENLSTTNFATKSNGIVHSNFNDSKPIHSPEIKNYTDFNCDFMHPCGLCSPKNFLSEVYKLLRFYNSTVVQIQVYSRNGLLVNSLHEKLMEIANLIVNKGEQTVSETFFHEQKTAIAINRFLRGTVPHTELTRKEAMMPVNVNSKHRKNSGVYSLYINAPTEKDLFCAAHLCVQFSIRYPADILLNVSKLTQPLLLKEHLIIYNTFNRYIYWDDYGKLLKT